MILSIDEIIFLLYDNENVEKKYLFTNPLA